MHRRTRLAGLAALALAAGASAPAQDRPPRTSYANPTALIAAEIALHQKAEAKGQWRAWREGAAPGAQLFAPDPVAAEDWLKNRPEPARPAQWEPSAVWISCDGSIGAVEGSWRDGAAPAGRYAALWQRQDDGQYRWLLRQRLPAAAGSAPAGGTPDMLIASVADCPPRPAAPGGPATAPARRGQRPAKVKAPPLPPVNALADQSRDGSLVWNALPALTVSIRRGGALQVVIAAGAPPPSG